MTGPSRGVPATRLRTSPCSQDQLARGLAGLQGLMSLRHIRQGIRANLWRTNAPCLHPSCEVVHSCMQKVRAGKEKRQIAPNRAEQLYFAACNPDLNSIQQLSRPAQDED